MSRTELHDLSPEQRQVVETWGQGLAVMAGAGSGKTTTLVIKCAELLKRKPDARFAAVSFTERSASDLKDKLSARMSLSGEGGSLSGHWVMTIHGLCNSVIREYPREAGFDGEEEMLSEGEAALLWERATDALWYDELPEEVGRALDVLLRRENRESLIGLLTRVRELNSFGALNWLFNAENPGSFTTDSEALAVLSDYVLQRYERIKRRRGALDFNDLERGADRALENPEIRAAFQRRFDLVLVDEFQDTNPVQAGIIRRFVRPDFSNLCVVGDPKQSIYRFRDADVSVFEEFCSQLPVGLSLTWNFRSRPGIIHFSNDVCQPLFEASDMQYEPLVPKKDAAPPEAGEAVVRLNIQTPADLASWIGAEVARGVPLKDMALLLRKIRGNEKWLKALTTAGIPIAVGSGGLFWEDPRVRELLSFLSWWDHAGNALSGGVFLRAPWVAMDDRLLDEWVQLSRTAGRDLQELFFASAHPLAVALAPLRKRAVRPGELLMALLISPEIEKELGASLLGLWHRTEELSSRGLDFHAVVSELTLAMQESRRERDVPPPRASGQLLVLTLHGSKGLEFPHVLLVDFPEKPGRAPSAPLLFWDRARGAFLGVRDEAGDRDKEHPVEATWREDEKRKSLAECKRLFYVALTRARERLVMVCLTKDSETTKDVDPKDFLLKDFWRGWLDFSNYPVQCIEAARISSSVVLPSTEVSAHERLLKPAPVRLKRPRHSVTEWNTLARCPRAYEWKFIRPIEMGNEKNQAPVLDSIFEEKSAESAQKNEEVSQRDLGTRVHACLEKGDFEGLEALEQEVGASRFRAAPLVSWAEGSPLMSADASEAEVWTELAFEIPVEGEVLVGSIDRLVRSEGSYRLVDFKVTSHSKTAEELLEAYRFQMVLYAESLALLEPEARGRTEVFLVNISGDSVVEVAVPVAVEVGALYGLARSAAEIVAGASGKPNPGTLCRMCEFRQKCTENWA